MKSNKKQSRQRRARKARARISAVGAIRLSVHRTPRHFYAQLISATGNKVLATASTVEAALKPGIKNGGNVAAAKIVGKAIAERASKSGFEAVAFDRSGFKYHGRVAAFADAAREAGLKF